MQPWPRGVLLLSYPYSRLHAASRHLCPCRVSIYYVPSPWRPHGQDQPSSGATRASAINKALPWSGERAMAAPAGWAAEIVRSVCVCGADLRRTCPRSGSGARQIRSIKDLWWLGRAAKKSVGVNGWGTRREGAVHVRADRQGSQKECVPTCRRARTRDVIDRSSPRLLCDVLYSPQSRPDPAVWAPATYYWQAAIWYWTYWHAW
jgi:hypothetical protein